MPNIAIIINIDAILSESDIDSLSSLKCIIIAVNAAPTDAYAALENNPWILLPNVAVKADTDLMVCSLYII